MQRKYSSKCVQTRATYDQGFRNDYEFLASETFIPDTMRAHIDKPKSIWSKIEANLFGWYIHGLLSNPKTHVINAASNTIPLVARVGEAYIEASIGAISKRDLQQFRLVAADLHGMTEGLMDAMRYISKRLQYTQHHKTRQETLKELNIPEALVYRNKEQLDTASDVAANPYKEGLKTWEKGLQWMRVAASGNQLVNMDTFFKVISFRAEISKRAMRKALDEGGTSEEITANFEKYKRIFYTNSDGAEMKHAIHTAEEATFTNTPLTKIDRIMAEKGHSWKPMKWIVPFRRTMVNVASWGLKRTPIALAHPNTWRQLTSKNPHARNEAIARMSFGSMFIMGIYAAWGDSLTGEGPRSSRAKDLWHRDGYKEHSIKIGGTHIPLDGLGGFGLILKAMGCAKETLSSISYEADDDADNRALMIANDLTFAVAEVFYDNHWSSNIFEAVDAIASSFNEDSTRPAEVYMSKIANALIVPNAIHQFNKSVIDGQQRDVSGVLESLQSRIPYWSKGLPSKVDLWGEPMYHDNFENPGLASPITGQDPLSVYLRKIGVKLPEPRRQALGVKMTPQEYQRMMILRGKGAMGLPPLRETLTKAITSPYWKKIPNDQLRANHIRSIINKYGKAARLQVQHDPEFDLGKRISLQRAKLYQEEGGM